MWGPVRNGPWFQARPPSGPCPASSAASPLPEDPRLSQGGRRKVIKIAQMSEFTQGQYLETYPKHAQIPRIEFRMDFSRG